MTSGQILRILGNVSLAGTATLMVACGGGGGDSNLDGNYFMCEGKYTKTNQAGTVLTSDGDLVPDIYCGSNPATAAPKQNSICVCAASQTDAVSKCKNVLANGMTAKDPNDNSITWSYTYNVSSAQQANGRASDKCSTQDQLASTSFALVGGPAEYSAALTGSVGLGVTVCIDYVVYTDCTNYSASSGLSGRVDYSVDGKLGSCPNTGCGFEMSRFMGTGGNLSISDTTVSGIDFVNAGTIAGTVQNDGSVQIPANAFALTVNYDRNGNHNSTVWSNGQVLTGHLSSDGTVLTLDTITIQDGGTLTLSGLTATTTLAPPVVKINPSSVTVECTSPAGAAVHLDGTATTGGNGQYFWKVDSGASSLTAGQFDATLAVGSHHVTLAVPNGLEGVGYATAPVNVVDTTPPTLTASNVTTVKVCDVSNVGVTLTPPTVTDVCTGVQQVTGRVVASNGQNLSQPIDLSNGKGSVPVGQHQVVWTATDNAGNAQSITQTISVIPSFYGTAAWDITDLQFPSVAPCSVISQPKNGRLSLPFVALKLFRQKVIT